MISEKQDAYRLSLSVAYRLWSVVETCLGDEFQLASRLR
jgi:hypothetical protein